MGPCCLDRFGLTRRASVLYGVGRHPEQVPPRYMAPDDRRGRDWAPDGSVAHSGGDFELVLGRTIYPGDWSQAFRLAFDADIGGDWGHSAASSAAKALLPALRHEGAQGYGSHAEMAMALKLPRRARAWAQQSPAEPP